MEHMQQRTSQQRGTTANVYMMCTCGSRQDSKHFTRIVYLTPPGNPINAGISISLFYGWNAGYLPKVAAEGAETRFQPRRSPESTVSGTRGHFLTDKNQKKTNRHLQVHRIPTVICFYKICKVFLYFWEWLTCSLAPPPKLHTLQAPQPGSYSGLTKSLTKTWEQV